MSSYGKCFECGATNPLLTPYYKCSECGYREKKHGKSNKVEKEQRKAVSKIIEKLTSEYKVKIRFPGKTTGPRDLAWTIKRKNIFIISIPRKTFYFPNNQLADTAVHEAYHVPNWDEIDTNPQNPEKDHGPQWFKDYRKNRKRIFKSKKFSEFVNSPNPQAKFKKDYEIYHSIYDKRKTKKNYKLNNQFTLFYWSMSHILLCLKLISCM